MPTTYDYINTLADLAVSIAEGETHWRNHDHEAQSASNREMMQKTVELRDGMQHLTAEHIQLALIAATARTRSVAAPDHTDVPPARKFVRNTYQNALTP